ncbi:MAG: glycosyltransferase family 4 protein [Victivallaceae bacterium]|nr:glycosyltransferase family 4 protein [Victivallaceae bacterium]
MKLTMFTRYGSLGASSRYRYYMYAERMRDGGDEVDIFNFFDQYYLRCLYRGGKVGFSNILKYYGRRFRNLCRAEGKFLIEYELFPYLPYWLEHFFLRKHEYILNFDDNVWEKYKGKSLLAGKYDALVRNASGVIVANDFLYGKVRPLNDNVIKIPTVVDPELYRRSKGKFDKFTLVWIGTPVTYIYLEKHAGILRRMAEKYDFELLVVARKALEDRHIEGVEMRFENWSQEREGELLARSHVGVMPLTEDEFSQGKSAFKLIQYAAAGLPVIASPVGENRNVVEDGKTGFLADSPEAWTAALGRLISDAGLYSVMAENACAASRNYSIQKYYPVFRDFIE